MKGVHATMLDSHLDEFMWRERHGQTSSLALHVYEELEVVTSQAEIIRSK